MTVRGWLGYVAAADPRMGLANTVAMIVVGNQPFYPFYVWSVAGAFQPAAFVTWLSLPFFASVPAVARRAPGPARALLLGAAIGNTALSAWALGTAAGAELFYVPCVVVAWAIVTPGQRLRPVAGALAASAAGLTLVRLAGTPLAALSATQAHALAVMHAISAACLLMVLAVQAWRIARTLSRSGS